MRLLLERCILICVNLQVATLRVALVEKLTYDVMTRSHLRASCSPSASFVVCGAVCIVGTQARNHSLPQDSSCTSTLASRAINHTALLRSLHHPSTITASAVERVFGFLSVTVQLPPPVFLETCDLHVGIFLEALRRPRSVCSFLSRLRRDNSRLTLRQPLTPSCAAQSHVARKPADVSGVVTSC